MSTAAVMSRAMQIAAGDPEDCREACEQLALGQLAEQRGESVRAMRAYELASASEDDEIRTRALERMAVLLRRASRFGDAAQAWSRVIDLSESGRRPLSRLERRAAEALAIHHEHRAKNLKTAKQYAEAIRETSPTRAAEAVEHRLSRLERKIQVATERGDWTSAGSLIARNPITGTPLPSTVRANDSSSSAIGRSSSMGFAHLPHFGRSAARAASTRFHVSQNWQRTVMCRAVSVCAL